jgi:oligopeptide/dipeptide ABC transporter ATP-binding protein
MNVLEVDHLRTEFHLRDSTVRAVDDVSFVVAEGECVGIVGESGCGKSTTGLSIMKLLSNVGHVAGGSIRLNGRDLATLGEKEMEAIRGNEVAMIFQDPMTSLNPTLTIGHQIAEGVRIHRGVSRDAAMKRALEVLTTVGMPRPEERLHYYPHQLSGGLRQRVMIAIALACEPRLLIADEPTTALDVTIQAQILNLLDELRERLNMATILITHDLGVIAGRTDRVLVMYGGRIVEEARTDELFARPQHPYSTALLASIPKLDQDSTQKLHSIPGVPPDLSSAITSCRFSPRCARSTDKCHTEEPELEETSGDPSHVFACFHPLGEPDENHVLRLVATVQERRDALERANIRVDQLASQPPIIQLVNVVKEFQTSSKVMVPRRRGGVKAVSDVSFSVRAGETFGLVGESGCGKTTIGRLMVGLETPDSGAILFEGESSQSLSRRGKRSRRRDLQLMFQDPYASLDPRMKVGRILREPLAVQGIGTRVEQAAKVREMLGEVGLPANAAHKYPHEFSGGQRQRIGFARALMLSPKLIIADEPVSALDVSIQAQLLNMMKSLQESFGLSYAVISHDLAVVKYLADRIGVMYLGKLVEVGPSQAIYERPVHPYTQALIDAIPTTDPAANNANRRQFLKGELPSVVDPPSGCRFRTRCPFAQEICAEIEPPLRLFGSGHHAACHFPLQEPLESAKGMTLVV